MWQILYTPFLRGLEASLSLKGAAVWFYLLIRDGVTGAIDEPRDTVKVPSMVPHTRGPASGFIDGTFLLHPHLVEGARHLSDASFHRGSNPIQEAPPS